MSLILLQYLLSFVIVFGPWQALHTNVFYAVLFRFLLQFLCPTVRGYGGSTVPRGVVGGRLPWGWERTRGEGTPPPPCISYALVQATVGIGTVMILYVI